MTRRLRKAQEEHTPNVKYEGAISMVTPANTANAANRNIPRWIFRSIHTIFSIPILGYIYSPFDKLPSYAPQTRYVFVPIMVLSGLWMWKGHVVRRLFSRRPAQDVSSLT
jgi:hypothetical protein